MENNLSHEKEFSDGEKISQRKKYSSGKIAGIIFCVLAAACTVVLMFVSGYFSGQMKTVDKLFTSIIREDWSGFRSCLSAEFVEYFTEADFKANKRVLQNLLGSEEVKTDVTFVKREKFDNELYDAYVVYVDFTVYNDDDHVTMQDCPFVLIREGMKWVIIYPDYLP